MLCSFYSILQYLRGELGAEGPRMLVGPREGGPRVQSHPGTLGQSATAVPSLYLVLVVIVSFFAWMITFYHIG